MEGGGGGGGGGGGKLLAGICVGEGDATGEGRGRGVFVVRGDDTPVRGLVCVTGRRPDCPTTSAGANIIRQSANERSSRRARLFLLLKTIFL